MEADANWWLESPGGLEVGGSGLSARLRDYARFGLFLLNDGVIDGERTAAGLGGGGEHGKNRVRRTGRLWVYALATARAQLCSDQDLRQFVFVDPDRQLVVAMWSAGQNRSTATELMSTSS